MCEQERWGKRKLGGKKWIRVQCQRPEQHCDVESLLYFWGWIKSISVLSVKELQSGSQSTWNEYRMQMATNEGKKNILQAPELSDSLMDSLVNHSALRACFQFSFCLEKISHSGLFPGPSSRPRLVVPRLITHRAIQQRRSGFSCIILLPANLRIIWTNLMMSWCLGGRRKRRPSPLMQSGAVRAERAKTASLNLSTRSRGHLCVPL